MIVFEFYSKFSLIECWSLALRQWQDWMDLNQNLWEEMKKKEAYLNCHLCTQTFHFAFIIDIEPTRWERKENSKACQNTEKDHCFVILYKKAKCRSSELRMTKNRWQKRKKIKKGTCTWINYDFGCLKRKGKVLRSAWNVLFSSFCRKW